MTEPAGPGLVVVLSGPSGVGKDSVLAAALARDDRLAGQVLFEDAADLAFPGVTTRLLLRIKQLAVDLELEEPAAGRNQVP